MGEFKFACPVCGQHITADSASSGSQLECPTCYRKIVVPQAPAEGQKFILSAAEANKPRPIQTPWCPTEVCRPGQSSKAGLFIALAVLLIGGGAAAYFVLQKKNPPPKPSPPEKVETAGQQTPSPTNASASAIEWKLDLSGIKIPDANAAGKIHGRDFNHERAILQGGQLFLRLGSSGLTDLGVAIYLPQMQGEAWSGQSVKIDTNLPRAPRVQLRWKDNGAPRTENFTGGYAMKLEFGQAANDRIPGKIYLCAPDDAKSCVAGIFDAEIRKPKPPKPKPPTLQPPKKSG